MRLVLDTNVVVAGLLWHGAPRRLIELIIDDEAVSLHSSPVLIGELANTLGYAKFTKRIAQFDTSIVALVAQYEALVKHVSHVHTPRVVLNDPDDDHVLACAVAAQAQLIVSGDKHLLMIKSYQGYFHRHRSRGGEYPRDRVSAAHLLAAKLTLAYRCQSGVAGFVLMIIR